ncbi:hypothetical protein ACJIZ3_017011 [Penstemon smallii]|uniref:Uncharacterized protein n=1 Tax=Penstemon smallii TaxID=265156 RepID=A0ABD3SUC8_9LAMI
MTGSPRNINRMCPMFKVILEDDIIILKAANMVDLSLSSTLSKAEAQSRNSGSVANNKKQIGQRCGA